MEIKIGAVTGTGAVIAVDVGFTPTWVNVFNFDGNAVLHWISGMGAGKGYKVLPGSGAHALIASGGITTKGQSDGYFGFTIGADTDVNVDTEKLVWQAGR